MRKIAFALLMMLLLSCVAVAADTYQTAKVVKWENSTYQQKKNKVGQWVVYSIQIDREHHVSGRSQEGNQAEDAARRHGSA